MIGTPKGSNVQKLIFYLKYMSNSFLKINIEEERERRRKGRMVGWGGWQKKKKSRRKEKKLKLYKSMTDTDPQLF